MPAPVLALAAASPVPYDDWADRTALYTAESSSPTTLPATLLPATLAACSSSRRRRASSSALALFRRRKLSPQDRARKRGEESPISVPWRIW